MAKSASMDASESSLWVFRVAIGLVLLSALLFLLGLATDHWHRDSQNNYGLWVTCQRGKCLTHDLDTLPDYHLATQVFQILATAAYTLSPIIHLILYCSKKDKSTDYRTRIFDIGFTAGAVFHFVSVIVFGLKHELPECLSWSYNMSSAGLGLAVVGVFLTTISRNAALRAFRFFPSKRVVPVTSRSDSHVSRTSGRNQGVLDSSGTSRQINNALRSGGTSSRSNNFVGSQTNSSIQSQGAISVNIQSHQPGLSISATSPEVHPTGSYQLTNSGSEITQQSWTPMALNASSIASGSASLHFQLDPSTSTATPGLPLPPLRAHRLKTIPSEPSLENKSV